MSVTEWTKGYPDSVAYNQAVADEVRAVLARKRIQRKDVAAEFGWSRNFINKRVAGEVSWGIPDLTALCDFLGVDVAELLGAAKKAALAARHDEGEIAQNG